MTRRRARRRRGWSFERQVLHLSFLTGAVGSAVALGLLWTGDYTLKVRWTLAFLVVVGWLVSALLLRERVIRPVQVLSNLLSALREGDYSLRAQRVESDDAMGLAFLEVNSLAATLQEQRIRALEATTLLRRVMEEIDVAVFALDAERRLRLVNRAGERLLGAPAARLLARRAEETGLEPTLEVEPGGTLRHEFPGESGRWQVRRAPFRLEGRPHELLVISNVSRVLREEERQAWERLIRVLSHEINNSLAPIQSIAGTLRGLLDVDPRPADLDDDLRGGLGVIATRSEALGRFMAAYARMARLPAPDPEPVDVAAWVRRTVALEPRLAVEIVPSDPATIHADPDQLDQLLINLVRNAVDATLETGGGVRAGWRRENGSLVVWVEDDGLGLPPSANLFVPFFTTKPKGSGIGLALSRQIAEAHGGTLALQNRGDARGARAVLVLPGAADGVGEVTAETPDA